MKILRLVQKLKGYVAPTDGYQKGFFEGLKRTKGVTAEANSADELKGLILVFAWTTKMLEAKLQAVESDNPVLLSLLEGAELHNQVSEDSAAD